MADNKTTELETVPVNIADPDEQGKPVKLTSPAGTRVTTDASSAKTLKAQGYK